MADQIDSIIKLRRGLDAQRQGIVFDNGEIVYSTDIKRVFIGDGSTSGANLVGNKNTIGTTPDNNGVQNDIFFETNSNVLYMLSSDSGPDVLSNYARISQKADEETLKLENGVYSINPNYFNNTSTGFVRLSGDTMDGFLTLNAAPTALMHAANKGYVDSLLGTNSVDMNILDTRYVNTSGDTLTGNLTIQSADLTVQGKVKIDSTLTVGNASYFDGSVNFKNNTIEKFKTIVKSIQLTSPNYTYQVTPDDTGCVLTVNSDANGFITIPANLDIGFNMSIINKTTNYSLSCVPAYAGEVTIRSFQGKIAINYPYGTCNMVMMSTNEMLIYGDLI